MKPIRLIAIIFFISFVCNADSFAAIKTWDGGGSDAQWSNALNWSGDVVPLATDDVLLDNASVLVSYTVVLPAGAVINSISSLTIGPSQGNTITFIIPSTNTGNPGLTVTGAGGIILYNNAVLKNSSGASTGSGLSVTTVFRINNGARYIHNTSRGNATIVSQLSTAAGTESGVFEFDVPTSSYVISLSGRTFGSLVLSSVANGGAVSYSGSGASAVTVNGNFQINAGVSLSTSMSANFIIKGNFTQAALSTFNLQSSTNNNVVQVKGNFSAHGTITETNTGLPVIELNGTTNQEIDASGLVINNSVDFRLNNAAGVTLMSNISFPFRFSIQSGNIFLDNYTLTTSLINQVSAASLTTNHFVTNGSGALKISGVTNNIVFPVGYSGTTYNPITVNNGNGSDYTVRVENGINPPVSFPTYGINRTWFIQSNVVTAGVALKFQYASADANAGAAQPHAMEVLTNGGGVWNISNGNNNLNPAGADPSWQITTSSGVSINTNPTPFALGIDGGWILPVNCYVNCSAIDLHDHILIKWNFPSCIMAEKFEVQRSVDGINFQTVHYINNMSNTEYSFSDYNARQSKVFYKIKVNNRNGWQVFSNVVKLEFSAVNDLKVVLFPQPVGDQATLFFQSPRKDVFTFSIVDMTGRIIKKSQIVIGKGNTNIPLDASNLQRGLHFIILESDMERRILKFVKS